MTRRIASRKTHDTVECSSPIGALAFQSDGQLFIAEWNGQVTSWHPSDGRSRIIGTVEKDAVSSIAFSPDRASALELEKIEVTKPRRELSNSLTRG